MCVITEPFPAIAFELSCEPTSAQAAPVKYILESDSNFGHQGKYFENMNNKLVVETR